MGLNKTNLFATLGDFAPSAFGRVVFLSHGRFQKIAGGRIAK